MRVRGEVEEIIRRRVEFEIDEAELRRWSNRPTGPIPALVVREFIASGFTWQKDALVGEQVGTDGFELVEMDGIA